VTVEVGERSRVFEGNELVIFHSYLAVVVP